MVMLYSANTRKQGIFFIGLTISVDICKHIYIGTPRYNYLVTQNGNSQSCIYISTLVENGLLIGNSVSICIFKYQYPVSLLPIRILRIDLVAVVESFTNPNPALFIDIHIGRIDQHWLMSKKLQLQVICANQSPKGILR